MIYDNMGPKICTKANLSHSAVACNFHMAGMPSNEDLMVFPCFFSLHLALANENDLPSNEYI
jgi:hypothetical protein